MSSKLRVAAIRAWLLVAAYYFYQYALRSAPSVMMPQLTRGIGSCKATMRIAKSPVTAVLLPVFGCDTE
jgi:hypothetical protein